MIHKPSWFRDGEVFVSYAETVGINKDGHDLFVVDSSAGRRTDEIDDRVSADIDSLLEHGSEGATSRWVPSDSFTLAVPTYYDNRDAEALERLLGGADLAGFSARSIGDLISEGLLSRRAGHGSPSSDLRNGLIPYIKVSDIRAGQVNINPSNMVPEIVARKFWRSNESGLRPFDLITPIRTSKNIGEFAVLMPGQERVVVTKEVLVLRVDEATGLDNFYLLWALSLKVVRDQWRRVVFMQTNREDVGDRFLEIEIPWPAEVRRGLEISRQFREYYVGVEELRSNFIRSLESTGMHHVFLGASISEASQAD